METTMKMVGNWSKQMDIPLHNALQATTELTGKSGRSAVERAIVLMAKTAASRNNTIIAKKKMKVRTAKRSNGKGSLKFVEKYSSDGGTVKRWQFQYPNSKGQTWDQAKLIGNRGLARRSWFWGLAGLKKHPAISKAIKGVTSLQEFFETHSAGMILTNKLNYIHKATVANIQEIAARSASNQIMAQAAKALERQYGVVVPRLAAARAKRAEKKLAKEFKEARA